MEKHFTVYNIIETRTDDPDWILVRVNNIDRKDYLLAYVGETLKEVYFVGEGIPNYFMSCRANNVYRISHYFVDREHNVVRRYEDGKLNRIYIDDCKGHMYSEGRVYTQERVSVEQMHYINIEKLIKDLQDILEKVKYADIRIAKPYYCK